MVTMEVVVVVAAVVVMVVKDVVVGLNEIVKYMNNDEWVYPNLFFFFSST